MNLLIYNNAFLPCVAISDSKKSPALHHVFTEKQKP